MAAQVQLALTLGPVVISFLHHSGVHDRPSRVELWRARIISITFRDAADILIRQLGQRVTAADVANNVHVKVLRHLLPAGGVIALASGVYRVENDYCSPQQVEIVAPDGWRDNDDIEWCPEWRPGYGPLLLDADTRLVAEHSAHSSDPLEYKAAKEKAEMDLFASTALCPVFEVSHDHSMDPDSAPIFEIREANVVLDGLKLRGGMAIVCPAEPNHSLLVKRCTVAGSVESGGVFTDAVP